MDELSSSFTRPVVTLCALHREHQAQSQLEIARVIFATSRFSKHAATLPQGSTATLKSRTGVER
jgi:hypothetical protein